MFVGFHSAQQNSEKMFPFVIMNIIFISFALLSYLSSLSLVLAYLFYFPKIVKGLRVCFARQLFGVSVVVFSILLPLFMIRVRIWFYIASFPFLYSCQAFRALGLLLLKAHLALE